MVQIHACMTLLKKKEGNLIFNNLILSFLWTLSNDICQFPRRKLEKEVQFSEVDEV